MKKILTLITIALLVIIATGCSSQAQGPSGTFGIWTIQLTPGVTDRLNLDVQSFNDQRGRELEFTFEKDLNVVAASFIFWTDPLGNKNYQAQYSSGPTTFRKDGNRIILEFPPDFHFAGAMDIRIYDDWLILNYTIQNQLVYTAQYRKTA